MARIRTIKPEFWSDEELSALPEATHLLAGALLNYADDFGYFNANPALVRAACTPIREPSVSIPESLRSLQTVGYIRLGNAPDGKRYGHVVKFDEHQRVSHPTASKISKQSIAWEDSGTSPEIFRNAPESFRPEQGTGNREEEGKEKIRASSSGADDATDEQPNLEGFESAEAVAARLAEQQRAAKAAAKAQRLAAVTSDAIDAYNEVLARPAGVLASVTLKNDEREKQVKRCVPVARQIAERTTGSSVLTPEFWKNYFLAVSEDDFKSGRVPGGKGHENWKPGFKYLTDPSVMTEVFDNASSQGAGA